MNEYRRSACRAGGHRSRQRRVRNANSPTAPASVSMLSTSVVLKPCQSTNVTVDTAPVTDAAARAIGPAASAGRTPRTTPMAPRIIGPSQSDAGASCDAGAGHRTTTKRRNAGDESRRAEAHARRHGKRNEDATPDAGKRRDA